MQSPYHRAFALKGPLGRLGYRHYEEHESRQANDAFARLRPADRAGESLLRLRHGTAELGRRGVGLLGARGRIAPKQGEYVAAQDIEVRFVGRQPNRLREVLECGLGGVRRSEARLAAVLPRLPELGAQPKLFIQQRERPAGLSRRCQPDRLVENSGGIGDRWPTLSPGEIERRRRNQA